MRKKRPSNLDPMSVAYWSTPEGKRLQDYCCQKSMPRGAIKADLSKQSPNNSYGPPMWYVDQKRNCRDCGKEFAWTAKKQQHWFEVLKLPIYVEALRCPACSRKVRLAKVGQKAHMAEIAQRPRHSHEAFFKSSPCRITKPQP
jgi:hypothetical protein